MNALVSRLLSGNALSSKLCRPHLWFQRLPAGRACNSISSLAEPRNQIVAFIEKCFEQKFFEMLRYSIFTSMQTQDLKPTPKHKRLLAVFDVFLFHLRPLVGSG